MATRRFKPWWQQQVQREVTLAYLQRYLGSDKAEVPPEFSEESAELGEQPLVQVCIAIAVGQARNSTI